MSDFLIYAARLQDAGVCSLWVSLGSNKKGTRLMHVSPDASTPRDLAARFPTRTFELDGTDRVLEALKDDMTCSEGGATEEKVSAAIEAHPMLADDLREWWELYKLIPPLDDDDLEGVELDEAEVVRGAERAKGILRGLDFARQHNAMKTSNGPSQRPPGDEPAWQTLDRQREEFEFFAELFGFDVTRLGTVYLKNETTDAWEACQERRWIDGWQKHDRADASVKR